jgi:malate dehydrogenase
MLHGGDRVAEHAQVPIAFQKFAVQVDGQYGVDGLYVGVPVVIGAGGAEEVIEINLTDEEKANLGVSVDAVKELLEACKALDSSLA